MNEDVRTSQMSSLCPIPMPSEICHGGFFVYDCALKGKKAIPAAFHISSISQVIDSLAHFFSFSF